MSNTIISFTTIEYPNEASMEKSLEMFQTEMAALADRLRPLGMIKFHSSRLFLPEEKLMFGNWLEYRDMAAFEACNKIWEKFGQEQAEKYSNYSDLFDELKINAYRGQVFEDWS